MQNMISVEVFSNIIAQTQPGGGAIVSQVLFFGLFFAAMWFLLIAPQRRKQKEHQKLIASLSSGDEVVTAGGVYGVITNVKADRFVLRVAEGTKIEIGKGFIHSVEKKSGAVETK
jgi:preprotein translocase subunit YajC